MCRTLYTVLYVAHLRMLVERYDIVYSRPEPLHSRVHLTITNIPTALYKPWPLPLPFSKSKVSKCSVCCALSYIPTIQIWYFDVIAKGHELSSHITPSELTVYICIYTFSLSCCTVWRAVWWEETVWEWVRLSSSLSFSRPAWWTLGDI